VAAARISLGNRGSHQRQVTGTAWRLCLGASEAFTVAFGYRTGRAVWEIRDRQPQCPETIVDVIKVSAEQTCMVDEPEPFRTALLRTFLVVPRRLVGNHGCWQVRSHADRDLCALDLL